MVLVSDIKLYAPCKHGEVQRHPSDYTVDAVYEWCEGARPATIIEIFYACKARHMTVDDSWELSNAREAERWRRNREISDMGGGG